MSGITTRSTRRAFFLQGSAALGAGVGATVAASALAGDKRVPPEEQLSQLRQQFELAEDREAIRRLQRALAHESGIDQSGMLKHTQTYEITTPDSVGVKQTSLVMGKDGQTPRL